MAGNKDTTKLRILAIERMLSFDKKINASQILRRLELWYDIKADRKTIYDDLAAINLIMPIESTPGRFGGYRLVDVLKEVENGG